MNGAATLIKALENEGVETVFGYPGGAIMPIYDALVGSKLRHILVRHEQAAALAADGYARSTGKVGVCLATSGPGATNLVTGIANAFLDSIPLVAITGQVPQHFMGTDAFQEVDIFGITMPVVKHSFIARRAEDLPRIIAEAFSIARSGRPGPVLIDVPKDVAVAEVNEPEFCGFLDEEMPTANQHEIELAISLMQSSHRPLIYGGGGIRIAKAVNEFRQFVEYTGAPVVTTLQGLGAMQADHKQFLGMLGMHGTKAANFAVQECDLLICIGARFDDRVTGKLKEFAPHAKVIHMDADASELGKLRFAHAALHGCIKHSMQALQNSTQPFDRANADDTFDTPNAEDADDTTDWRSHCQANKGKFAFKYDAPFGTVYAPKFINELSARAGNDTFITCDVGQHQMWVAQHYAFDRPEQHLTSAGLGTMGFGVPAAIGAQLANPESKVITLSGDGSIMMNIQELATINRYNLPIKIVIFDNKTLGMVRQWQELFFEERYSEVDLSDNPEFSAVAQAFGIPAIKVTHADEVTDAIDQILNTEGPLLVHVLIDPKENVWPLVPPGKSNSQMMEASV
jgi:acetolactate synthase-1/2/3 large subunit